MLLDQGKELFGNTLYTIGDIYTIAYACNHHDHQMVLWNHIKYNNLVPGDEVQFIGKVSKREGVFARVKRLYEDTIYDIDYTNLGGLSQCETQKPKTRAKTRKQLRLEKKKLLAKLLKKTKLEEPINERRKDKQDPNTTR